MNLTPLYEKVFNTDGTVKNCGKDACIELIIAMRERFPGINFGDKHSGMMNVDMIKKMYMERK